MTLDMETFFCLPTTEGPKKSRQRWRQGFVFYPPQSVKVEAVNTSDGAEEGFLSQPWVHSFAVQQEN